jgi:putative transcriptional regulator
MVATAALACLLCAQSQRPVDLAMGKLLVASRDLGDPNFAETVILLVKLDEDGALGLVVNRISRYTISRVLPEAKNNNDPMFVGGPVSRTGVLALGRSLPKPEGTEGVVKDIWLTRDADFLQKAVSKKPGPDKLRLYLGYAGWGPGQLQFEVRQKAWFIFPAEPDAVFSMEPDSLWKKMIGRIDAQIALLRLPAAGR